MRESLADYCIRFQRQDLLSQWDAEGNAPLTPDAVSYGSRRKVWWQCDHGHRWQAAVYTRTGGESGCPYCAGKRPWPGFNDLASQYPDLAAQWHPTRNGALTPDQVLCGSNRRVWWQCPQGHQWSAIVKSRTEGAGCPYCASRQVSAGVNDLAARFPHLAQEWHPEKNGRLTPGTWCPAAGGRSGGSAPRATCGRLPLPPGRWMGRAARCAPESRWRQGRMTWPPSSPTWPSSGTGRATGP